MLKYVINLDRREDRWNNIKQNKLFNDFIRFSAFDGINYKSELIKYNLSENKIIKFLEKTNIPVPKGAFGCLMSHILLLEHIMNNAKIQNDEYVIILEDDFLFSKNFETNYNKLLNINLSELDIEFLYLGGRFESDYKPNNLELFEKTDNENIYYRKQIKYGNFDWDRCTFSYIVKKSVCEKLIKILSTYFVVKDINGLVRFEAIDYIYSSAYNKIKMFDFFPHLFYSNINGDTDIQGHHMANRIIF